MGASGDGAAGYGRIRGARGRAGAHPEEDCAAHGEADWGEERPRGALARGGLARAEGTERGLEHGLAKGALGGENCSKDSRYACAQFERLSPPCAVRAVQVGRAVSAERSSRRVSSEDRRLLIGAPRTAPSRMHASLVADFSRRKGQFTRKP